MYPAMKLSLVCLLLAAVASCKQNPSQLDGLASSVSSVKVVEPAHAAPVEQLPTDPNDRLARLERKLEKITKVLDEKLGPAEPDPETTYSVAVDPIDPSEGPKTAKVTIVEGFEFLCPYCAMANPTVDQILAKYPKDVRVVGKYLIIHGMPAVAPGIAACAAGKQGKYTQMKNAIWSHFFRMENGHPAMNQDQIAPDNLDKLAIQAGLDLAKMKADMTSPECQSWIASSRASLQPIGVNATPAFFVNGRYVSGAQPVEVFDHLIQEEIAKADKAIADGVAPADYYQNVVVARGQKRVKGRFED
jgi:predicted DsbA family dithiol-disulfide isomerase